MLWIFAIEGGIPVAPVPVNSASFGHGFHNSRIVVHDVGVFGKQFWFDGGMMMNLRVEESLSASSGAPEAGFVQRENMGMNLNMNLNIIVWTKLNGCMFDKMKGGCGQIIWGWNLFNVKFKTVNEFSWTGPIRLVEWLTRLYSLVYNDPRLFKKLWPNPLEHTERNTKHAERSE